MNQSTLTPKVTHQCDRIQGIPLTDAMYRPHLHRNYPLPPRALLPWEILVSSNSQSKERFWGENQLNSVSPITDAIYR
ncbi:MAG: hypothetical protein F6K26_00925 [Moorea sp. SIO2I5]|nr:hypothetical protein [Moorena sp. SIO2I5]